VRANLEALRTGGLGDHRLLGHLVLSPVVGERQAEAAQQRAGALVVLGGRRDRDVQTADRGDVVVVDLGEDDLLADAERVVAAAVERPGVEPPEVADPGQRDRHEPVEELVHAGSAQRHARADRHAFAQLERGDRLAGAAHLGALPRDRGQLVHRAVERLGVGLRLADTHVQRDLRHPRNLHHGGQPELLLQPRAQLALVQLLEPRRVAGSVAVSAAHLSSSSPQPSRLQTRTFTRRPLISLNTWPTRVGRLQVGQTTITFDAGSGAGLSMTPPGIIVVPPMRFASRIGRGFVCRLTTFRFSTTTRRSPGRASTTRPCLPRSLPESTWTRSPFFTFMDWAMATGPPVRG